MHRPFLSLVACVTAAACARSNPPVEAPTPAPIEATAPAASAEATPPPGIPPERSARVEEREYRGAYTRGFEASWFAPCDAPLGDRQWWVTLTEPARLQRDSLLRALSAEPTGALAVRWRGRISERMRAGHLGAGTRYMLVTEVLEVRPLVGGGFCGAGSATGAMSSQ
jgi:hypothetical protein